MSEHRKIRWFQFSLRSLFLMTACAALGLTALKFATHGWSIALTTTTAALMLVALRQAVFGREAKRPFWSGVAVGAWGYMAILLLWGSSDSSVLGNDLATGEFLNYLFLKFNPEAETNGGGLDGYSAGGAFGSGGFSGGGIGTRGTGGAAFNVSDPFLPQPKDSPSDPPLAQSNAAPVQTPPLPTPSSDSPPENASPGSSTEKISPEALKEEMAAREAALLQAETAKGSQQRELGELLNSRRTYFPRIGHCLFTLLIGWIGGLAAQAIAATRREPSTMSQAAQR